MQSLPDLIAEIKSEFIDFRVVPKSQSTMMKLAGVFLKLISFGQMLFSQEYVTTIGTTVYVPDAWDAWSESSKAIILRHERVHMRQQKRLSRPLYIFLYLIPFFPIFLAYGRAHLEMEAYTETIRAELQAHGTARVWSSKYQTWLVSQFVGPAYLWMWPFKSYMTSWVKNTVEQCVEEYVGYTPKSKK